MVFHQLIGHAAQVQIDVVLAKVIAITIVIVQLAFNVEQTIVIETSRQLEVIGLSKLTVVLVIYNKHRFIIFDIHHVKY